MDLIGKWLAVWMPLPIALGGVIAMDGDYPNVHVMVAGRVVGETPQAGLWVRIQTISQVDGTDWILEALPEGMQERPARLLRWDLLRNGFIYDEPLTAAQVSVGFRPPRQ